MPKRKILVGEERDQTVEFLSEYFSDTKSIPIFAKSRPDVLEGLELTHPDLVFMRVDWLEPRTAVRLQEYRKQKQGSKFFSLGYAKDELFKWDNQFEIPLEPKPFRKALFAELTFPPLVKLLVVDDEQGIGEIFKDYFELRKDPSFQVSVALDGMEGFKKLEALNPDCLVLDIKMPVRSGIEMYADVVKSGRETPVVIFVESTSPEEIAAIRKVGNPILVEKSGHQSSMPEMLALIKKLIYFA